jgi:hypothetical protein
MIHLRTAVAASAILTMSSFVHVALARAADGPLSGIAEAFAISLPATALPRAAEGKHAVAPRRINPLAGEADAGRRDTWFRTAPRDPLASYSWRQNGRTPAPDLSFEGAHNPAACGGCTPPDPIGDIGKSHFVQIVNATKVGIYNKSDGTLATPVFNLSSLFPAGPCVSDAGDPVVLYDDIAKRWLLAQFANPNHLCFAVSRSRDPLGSYFTYVFDVGEFPDYFKVGVWPSGYYVSANESTYTAYAFDRDKMLIGDASAGFVKFTGETNFLLPADVDGGSAPSGGGLFYTFKDNKFHGGADRIALFRLTPHFGHPDESTFTRLKSIPISPFTYTVCGAFNFDCIPQKDTVQRVDAVSEWPMHRFAYREVGTRKSLVGNFTVGGGTGSAGAAVRWFELRKDGSNWSLFQEGTQDLGDGLDRFMGSIAMDKDGNIALGYSASGKGDFPSIRYATRSPGDPPGTLQREKVLKQGRGSQTGSDRWGDYSAMTVDPVGGCQFWYTNEYYRTMSPTEWHTRIGAFTVPGC